MLEIEARSRIDPGRFWRRVLPPGGAAISCNPPPPDAIPHGVALWLADWDNYISSPHAFLSWDGDRILVRKRMLPREARNPIFHMGAKSDEFRAVAGDWFQIGDTLFVVHPPDPSPAAEVTYTRAQLKSVRFSDADRRLEALANLPQLIRSASTDKELEEHVAGVLLAGLPHAIVAAVVQLVADPAAGGQETPIARTVIDRPGRTEQFRPARRLTRAALREKIQGVLYVHEANLQLSAIYPGTDWSLCTPLPDDDDPSWGLYAAGHTPRVTPIGDESLQSDLKFAELTADVFASLRRSRKMERRLSAMARYFPPSVLEVLVAEGDQLRPARQTVTVLFCDLRNSSRLAEAWANDLDGLWNRFQRALSIMTNAIVDHGGAIGDFQGDATMGFWGWPKGDPTQVERACKAALTIRRQFAQLAMDGDETMRTLGCGVGVAHGPAVAGRIGTYDQFKVSVFGPVVNLAARLESLTKRVGVPVLVDGAASEALGNVPFARLRRIAHVCPAGMDHATEIRELLPQISEPQSLPEGPRLSFEAAADHFRTGDWATARTMLARLTAGSEGPRKFLEAYMNDHPDGPPTNWDGVVRLVDK